MKITQYDIEFIIILIALIVLFITSLRPKVGGGKVRRFCYRLANLIITQGDCMHIYFDGTLG